MESYHSWAEWAWTDASSSLLPPHTWALLPQTRRLSLASSTCSHMSTVAGFQTAAWNIPLMRGCRDFTHINTHAHTFNAQTLISQTWKRGGLGKPDRMSLQLNSGKQSKWTKTIFCAIDILWHLYFRKTKMHLTKIMRKYFYLGCFIYLFTLGFLPVKMLEKYRSQFDKHSKKNSHSA